MIILSQSCKRIASWIIVKKASQNNYNADQAEEKSVLCLSMNGRNSRYTIQVMEKENGKLFARVYKFHRTKKLDDDQGSIATHTPTIRKKDKGNVKH